MARELEIWHKHTLVQGNAPEHTVSRHKFVTLSGDNHSTGDTVSIGTTLETVSAPSDIGTVRMLYLENLDETNFVIIGATAAVAANEMPIKLFAGDFVYIPWRASQFTASADSGSINLYREFYEV